MKTHRMLIAACMMLAPFLLLAGTTGKITGRITDRATGEGLISANVTVVGTSLGAATNIDGYYVIVNVPPGTYEVRVTMVGFAPVTARSVKVVTDQTTPLSLQMESSAVQMADVVVQAERPLVQKDLTATLSVVNSEQIAMLPVRTFVEVVQLQAGVVGEGTTLHVRGGRDNEVAYMIDGMYVKDPVLGSLGTRVNNDAIQELVFLSGTYNAEYGNALSGVVNIVTKEGASTFGAELEAATSEFGVGPYKNYKEDRVSGSLTGPVFPDVASFFLSGEMNNRNGSWLPYGYDKSLSGIGKVSMSVLPELRAVLTGRYSQDMRQPYSHSWKYIPDQYLRIREYSRHSMLTITHNVNPTLFYDVRLSYFNQSYYSGIDKDTANYLPVSAREYYPQYGNGFEFYSLADPVEVTDNRTATLNAKADMVWQVDKSNELKVGMEVKKHHLNYFNVYDPKRPYPYITIYEKDPIEGAAYFQDKIEVAALVVNLGLRYDYADQRAPFRSDPLDPNSVVPSAPKKQWSPRLGVAHPISDRTSLHFSYGRFFQNPDYRYLYENSQYDLNVREPLFGQPSLDAERTTAYEVGVTHQFTDRLVGTFTAHYKDISGLIGTRYYLPYIEGRYIGYTLYVNESYANVKGFEVGLNLRRTRYLAGSLTYTYSVAKGNASSETENYPGTTESTLLYPLDFDKTHVLNVNLSAVIPDAEGPELFGARPLENTWWNLVFRANSGYPYTPSGRDIGFVEKNSARMPGTYTLDLEASKEWKVWAVTFGVFVEVLNLTGHRNVTYVYTDTGLPDATTLGDDSPEYIKDPSNYGPPRRIRLGLRLRY